MLDVTEQETDDDAMSVTSDMGIGRGQSLLLSLRGQNRVNRGLRRGVRGLMH